MAGLSCEAAWDLISARARVADVALGAWRPPSEAGKAGPVSSFGSTATASLRSMRCGVVWSCVRCAEEERLSVRRSRRRLLKRGATFYRTLTAELHSGDGARASDRKRRHEEVEGMKRVLVLAALALLALPAAALGGTPSKAASANCKAQLKVMGKTNFQHTYVT